MLNVMGRISDDHARRLLLCPMHHNGISPCEECSSYYGLFIMMKEEILMKRQKLTLIEEQNSLLQSLIETIAYLPGGEVCASAKTHFETSRF